MYSGLGRRNEPHAERKYQAIQAIEQNYGPRGRHPALASSQYRRETGSGGLAKFAFGLVVA